jgi:hypothetical protein
MKLQGHWYFPMGRLPQRSGDSPSAPALSPPVLLFRFRIVCVREVRLTIFRSCRCYHSITCTSLIILASVHDAVIPFSSAFICFRAAKAEMKRTNCSVLHTKQVERFSQTTSHSEHVNVRYSPDVSCTLR